jgi:imidazolonepropionase-like amidohydrolase
MTSASGSAQTLTIQHATVIDVRSGQLHPHRTVVIEGNRITAVIRDGRRPASGTIVDAHGRFLIPGLWDMHTHVFFDRTAADGKDLILPLFVAFGITGVRDMGSALDPVLEARAAIAAHQWLGPRMVVFGPMLDGPKSSYKAAIAITTPESGRQAVDMLHSRGVDFIKVQSGVPRDAYFAIAEETRRDHIEFEGHVPDAIRASEAIDAGQRTFEHLIGIFEASSPDQNTYLTGSYGDKQGTKSVGKLLSTYDPARERQIVALIAQHHVWQCPTLYWERGQWLVDSIDYRKDPNLRFAAHSWQVQWPAMQKGIAGSLDTDPLATRERFVGHELGIVHRLQAAGVPFLAGTDTPAGVDLIPGISLHQELERFVAAGFTPLQALETATLNPALFLHRSADLGAVEAGKLADLVLLDRNPLTDIRNTRSVSAVVLDGRYLSKEELEQLRSHLIQIAASRGPGSATAPLKATAP